MQHNATLTQMMDSLRVHNPNTWPTLSERKILLQAFYEAHRWSLEIAIFSVVRLRGGVDEFDLKNHFRFDLRYGAVAWYPASSRSWPFGL